jgi:hypothetical protein
MNTNLQNLKIHDLPLEAKDGARMILPGDLQQLLDIFPTKQVLVVDLRPASAFEKSHIHEAINLRAPVSFIQHTSLEMIQDTFTDEQSRRTFAKWSQSRCVVFYDRVVEFAWECPVADAVHDKFRRKGWKGECFVLKGHYHEFSSSFDKYISGNKMTRRAKEYLDSLRQKTASEAEAREAEAREAEARYAAWLRERDTAEYRGAQTELTPSKKAERARAVDEHQRELEAELEMRFPALWKKFLALRPAQHDAMMTRSPTYRTVAPGEGPAPRYYSKEGGKWADSDDFETGARLVEPLARGLVKMAAAAEEAAAASRGEQPDTPLPKYNKGAAAEGDKAGDGGTLTGDEYDDFENDEGLRSDPGFQKAGSTTKGGGAGDDGARKGRQTQTQTAAAAASSHSFWRFRIKPGSK